MILGPRTNPWMILAALILARTVMGYQFQSVVGVSAFLNAELGIDLAQLGVLVGLYMLPGIIVAYPGGALAQRLGNKTISLLGLLLMAAGGAVTAVSVDFGMLAVGRVISGSGAVILNVVLAAMVAAWFRSDRLVTAMALLVTSWPIGIGVALASGPAIAESFGWLPVMWISVIASLATMAIIGVVYRDPGEQAASGKSTKSEPFTKLDFALATWSGQVWAFYNVGFIIYVSFLPALMIASGSDAVSAGWVSSLATWTLVLSLPIGGLLIDRFGRDYLVMQICFFCLGVAMILTVAQPPAVLVVIFAGIFAGPPPGAIMALPARALRPSVRSTGMGIYFTWYYVWMALLPPLAGWIGESVGAVSASFIFGAAVMLAAMASLARFQRRFDQSRNSPRPVAANSRDA